MNNQFFHVLPNGDLHFDWFAVLSGIQRTKLTSTGLPTVFSKKKLFLSKVAVSIVIGIGFAAVLFIAFGLLVMVLNGAGRLPGGISLFPQSGNRVWN